MALRYLRGTQAVNLFRGTLKFGKADRYLVQWRTVFTNIDFIFMRFGEVAHYFALLLSVRHRAGGNSCGSRDGNQNWQQQDGGSDTCGENERCIDDK